MKIQGPWGAEGVMHIFTAWLATSSTTNEHITASVYSYLSENATIKKKKKEEVPHLHKAWHAQICMRLQCGSSET